MSEGFPCLLVEGCCCGRFLTEQGASSSHCQAHCPSHGLPGGVPVKACPDTVWRLPSCGLSVCLDTGRRLHQMCDLHVVSSLCRITRHLKTLTTCFGLRSKAAQDKMLKEKLALILWVMGPSRLAVKSPAFGAPTLCPSWRRSSVSFLPFCKEKGLCVTALTPAHLTPVSVSCSFTHDWLVPSVPSRPVFPPFPPD